MCESGLRTIRCKSKSLKGGFFCVNDPSISDSNSKIIYFSAITIFDRLSFRVGHFHRLTSRLFGCHGLLIQVNCRGSFLFVSGCAYFLLIVKIGVRSFSENN